MNLVDLETAAGHLRLDLDADADLIGSVLNGAESLVLAHIEQTAEELTEEHGEIPFGVKAAVLVVALNLHDNPELDPLSDAAISLMRPFRNPGVF